MDLPSSDAPRGWTVSTTAASTTRYRSLHALATALVAALVVVLAVWNLPYQPRPWYDEGQNLQSARNLARTGQYGLIYEDNELRPFDLQQTTGPTVIVPVALSFKFFGLGLVQGRAIMAVYVLLAALGLFRVASVLYGRAVALLAVVILCATERASPALTRDLVGEAAALAYLLWGAAAFISARSSGRTGRYALAGLLFGLAILTKGQFGLIVPAVVVVWLIARRAANGFTFRQLAVLVLVSLVPVLLWQLYQVAALGPQGFITHLRGQSAVLNVSAATSPLANTYVAARYLILSSLAAPALVAFAYVGISLLQRDIRRVPAESLLLPVFTLLWLGWFLVASAAYDRYTVPIVAICSIFLGVLFVDLVGAVRRSEPLTTGRGWLRSMDPLRLALAAVLALPVLAGLFQQLAAVYRPPAPAAQQLAATISSSIAPAASIESIEWQLDILTEHEFHHPPPFVPLVPYDVPTDTTYLVDGPMSKAFGVYTRELSRRAYERIGSADDYDLYRRVGS